MGRFKTGTLDQVEKHRAAEVAGIRALYCDEVILEAASKVIVQQTLDGDHAAINDFEAGISAAIQGQTLSIYEG